MAGSGWSVGFLKILDRSLMIRGLKILSLRKLSTFGDAFLEPYYLRISPSKHWPGWLKISIEVLVMGGRSVAMF